ncbi:hypothetical protein BDV96DRAFT_400495 [Lophiotrema nucula]|uniref:Uncharacterized protein n=1 Tax=Lophiotrema nucula TaxID=690887 RepID=A0A6A5ZH42_9PLEO|nr:hypothetical protein BDV96DRAFT_400495 [Lophiotrema nucula]
MQQQQPRRRSKSPKLLRVCDDRTSLSRGTSQVPLHDEAVMKRVTEEMGRKRHSTGEILHIPDSRVPTQQQQQQQQRPIPPPVRIPDQIEPDLFRSPKRREPLRIPPSPDSPLAPTKAPEPLQYKPYSPSSLRDADSQTAEESQVAARQHARNFSHPFSKPSGSSSSLAHYNMQRRSPKASQKRPRSHRSNSRLPPSLRRWSSLETIESVTTMPEVAYDDEDTEPEPEVQRPSTSTEETNVYFSAADEEDNTETPRSFRSVPSTTAEESSGSSSNRPSSVRTSSTTTNSNRQSAGSSLLRRLKAKKLHEPLLEPEHLEIERTVSVEQSSIHRSNSSGSIGTISSGRPSLVGYPSSDASASRESQRSLDPKDWKSSNYDVSNLTEAELKKCKKKGINPALFAEMKAARKGKWASPIGGNTFL